MRRPFVDLTEPARNLEESMGTASEGLDAEVDLSLPPPADDIEVMDRDRGGVGSGGGDGDDEEEDDDDSRIFTPPPHIAARLFYRPTNQARRKDSAASSRRNSISSISSHGCTRQAAAAAGGAGAGGEPQSKYIAQHLRRASILEDRRARLADRAAHAEKVRLRAALAKAAFKDTSASQERAIAAAQARERNLAEIAAACAEEVKRAKAVAESMKEKREQEIRKMRLQMEERHAEAERRREELRNRTTRSGSGSNSSGVGNGTNGRGRGHSLVTRKPTLVEVLPELKELKERDTSPMREDVAVAKIQWWWRGVKRRQAVHEFAELGLTIDGVRETSFEKVTELLSRENVLVLTVRVLRICGLKEGEAGSVDEMAAVRSFLSAFLILGHPAQVLSNKEGKGEEQEQVGDALAQPLPRDDLANPRLQDLVGKARDLLISFENILQRLAQRNNYTPPPALLEAFPEVYATFHNAFIAWKARDSNALVELMIMQFVELDAILQTVKDSTDGSVDEVYKQSIQNNQVLLLVRIKKLAGAAQAKKMVGDAIRKARKARARKPTGDTKPRVAEDHDHAISAETAAIDGLSHESAATTATETATRPAGTQTVTPPATPQKGPALQFRIGRFKGLLPDNRIVVHELAVNKEFRIEPDEYRVQQEHLLAPLFAQMRATMRADDQEAHFLLLLEVAKYIREKMQRLVRPGNSMHTFIAELLDTDVARRQFAVGSFSYEKFFQAMAALLPKLCAPVRDEEVRDLIDNRLLGRDHYVDRLEALLGFIDVMLSDYANYLLQLAAPGIVESAAPYEAKMFAAALDAGAHDLSAATAVWRVARSKVLAEAMRRDPDGVNHPRSRPTANRIYAQMMVDLFTRLSPIRKAELPEMLRFDHSRAVAAGATVRRIVVAGAILLQCKNLLKRDVRSPWKTEAQRIMAVLERADGAAGRAEESSSSGQRERDQTTPVDGIMAALETGRCMPAATKAHLRALVTKFVAAGAEAASSTSPFHTDLTPATPSSSSYSTPASISFAVGEPSEPVLRLLLQRLRTHILARLGAASASEKARVTGTAGERLAGLGLAEFVDRVRELVDIMSRVGTVDRDAHSGWWDRVAEAVEGEDNADSNASANVSGGEVSA